MKHFDRVLLCTLWLIAALLVSCFWFDVWFGFDLLARSHWRYLALAQVETGPISIWFYISLLGSCAMAIIGLYFIWHTKGPRAQHPTESGSPTPLAPPTPMMRPIAPMTPSPNPTVVRPPRLDIPIAQYAQPQIRQTTPIMAAPSPPPTVQMHDVSVPSASLVDPAVVNSTRVIFQDAGYTVKGPPKIGDVQPDIWAIGADEVLYIGTICPVQGNIIANEGGTSKWRTGTAEFDSPVWLLTGMVEKLRVLFAETLDSEIQIQIRPFVLMDGGVITNADTVRPIWDAFGAKIFTDVSDLHAFMATNRNRNLSEEEQGDFDAYAEYIDTVADYFNNQ